MRLGLGTVQFGLDYGISNAGGRTPEDEVRRILDLAAARGVDVLDTAAAYGDAEAVLGRCLPPDHGFSIVTKTLPCGRYASDEGGPTAEAVARIEERFMQSLRLLGVDGVDTLLAHHAADLTRPGGERLIGLLEDLRARGLTRRIGVSVYDAAEIEAVLERFTPQVVQLPLSVLDQRLASGGQLARLKALGVEIHVRSVFLQGLALMDPEAAPEHFEPVRHRLRGYRDFLDARGLSPVQGAFAYVRSLAEPDVILVGVNDAAQLAANVDDFQAAPADLDMAAFAMDEPRFVNPFLWGKP